MGRVGHVRRSGVYRLRSGRDQTAQTDVHRSLAGDGRIFHCHDPASEAERQNSQDDRPGAHIEQGPPREPRPIHLPFPHAASYGKALAIYLLPLPLPHPKHKY